MHRVEAQDWNASTRDCKSRPPKTLFAPNQRRQCLKQNRRGHSPRRLMHFGKKRINYLASATGGDEVKLKNSTNVTYLANYLTRITDHF